MKTIKIEVDVIVDDKIGYYDIKDVIEDALDEEFNFFEVNLIDIQQ